MTVYPNAIDGYSQLPILVDLISPVRAADVNRLRNTLIDVEKELGINPSGTYATVRARLDALELGIGGGGGGGGGSAGTGEDFLSGMIETPTEKEYFLTSEIPYDGYIYSITTQSSGGSCTLTTKINGIPVTATPNSVSTTEQTQFTSGANAFNSGDEISIEVTGNSSCADMTFTVLFFVTPGGMFGEANTGSNVGVGGVGPFKQKSGLVLQFRNTSAGSNKISVTLDAPNNEIDIDAVEANFTLNNIGGILSIAKGGTGQTTANAAFNALAPTTTKGDLVVRNATVNTRVPVGIDGYFLIADSTQATGVKWDSASAVGANTALSNLVATAINVSLVPAFDDTLDLGTSLLRWRDLYLGPTSLRFVTTAGETGTVRNWRLHVRETAGSSRGSIVFQEGATEYLYITPVGFVGIGVTDPSSILDINGVTSYRGVGSPPAASAAGQGRIYFDASSNRLRFSENGAAYVDFGTGGGGGGANTSLSNLVATNINTSLIPAFDDGYDLGTSSQRWRDLYLGPTSLHVVSNAAETGIARDWRVAIAEVAGSTQGRLRFMEGSSEYVAITPTGLVGIGITNPIYDIHVTRPGSATIQAEVVAATGYASVVAQNNSGSYLQIFSAASGQSGTWFANDTSPLARANTVGFRTGGTEAALVFAAQGNVPLQIGQNDTTRLVFNTTLGILNPSNKDYDFQIKGQTTSNLFYVDASTNKIGIGTNTPGASTPGNAVLDVVTSTDTKIVSRTTGIPGTGFASFTLQSTGATNNPYFEWQMVPSNTDQASYIRHNYVGATTVNNILVLKGDGKVGIGTTDPQQLLHVQDGNALTAIWSKNTNTTGDSYITALNDTGITAFMHVAGSTQAGTYLNTGLANASSSELVISGISVSGIRNTTSSPIVISVANLEKMRVTSTGVVINEQAADLDFRVEGDNDQNLFFTDASSDFVGFGTNVPSSKIDLNGAFTQRGMAAPAVSPAGQGRIYFDSTSNIFRASENSGAYVALIGGSGSGGANTSLSNLTATTINTSLIPGIDDGYDLGTSSLRWRDLFLGPTSLHIVSNSSETVTARNWAFAIEETAGSTQGRLKISESAVEYISITPIGRIGIGTTVPNSTVHVRSTSNPGWLVEGEATPGFSDSYFRFAGSAAGAATAFVQQRSRGTLTSPTVVLAGDRLGLQVMQGYDGSAYQSAAAIRTIAEGAISAGIVPGVLQFFTTNSSGTETERVRINSVGLVGIGTTVPASALHVQDIVVGSSVQIRSQSTSTTINAVVDARNTASGGGEVYIQGNGSATGGTYLGITANGAALLDLVPAGTSAAFIRSVGTLPLLMGVNDVEQIRISTTEVVFNDTGAIINFRIEGDTDPNLLFASAVDGYVGIGTNVPTSKLDLNGAVTQRGQGAPPLAPTGQGRIYFDSTLNSFRMSENGSAYGPLGSTGAANTSLSNLITTTINTDLLPSVDDGYSIGSSSLAWKDGYFTRVRANNYFELTEVTAPVTPSAGHGFIYEKSDNLIYFKNDLGIEFDLTGSGSAGANTALSNLTTTNISASLIPGINDGYDLGTDGYRWRDGYFGAETLHIGTSLLDEARLSYDTATDKFFINMSGNNRVTVQSDGYVGVGTTAPTFNLEVNGTFGATTKSFIIPHPMKPGMKLRYGSLEGPENGVYIRGKLNRESIIELPDYWMALVDESTITVSLTPIGRHQKLYVHLVDDNRVHVKTDSILTPIVCYYTVFAERKDVVKLIVEI